MNGSRARSAVARRTGRLLLLAVGIGVIAYLGFGLSRWLAVRRAYAAEYDQARAAIREMERRPPPGFDPGHWESAVIWSHNAYVETFMFGDTADLDALRQFGAVLRGQLDQDPGPDLLEWIWDELERASPRGKRYVGRYRGEFREQLELARKGQR